MATIEHISRAGFVLAGGSSSRMGADKAFLKVGERTLLEQALHTVGSVCLQPSIVGDRDRLAAYSGVISDVFPGCGPLGGIHAALSTRRAELNLVLAVDMPLVTGELLNFLLSAAESSPATITVPRTGRGWQPLCAVYRCEFLSVAEAALREGKYKIDTLYSQVAVRSIDTKELMAAGFTERLFLNVNTPDQLRALLDP